MDIETALKEATEQRERLVAEVNGIIQEINRLNQKRIILLQEAFKVEGRVETLTELKESENVPA